MSKDDKADALRSAPTILRSNDALAVDYEATPEYDNTGLIEIRRTVWTKSRLRSGRDIAHQEVIGLLTKDEAVELIRELATCLSVM